MHFGPRETANGDVQVDLVGAVHVGEKSYYAALNECFKKYDAVLYELVAPPGTRIPKGAKPGAHPVAMLQNGLKDMLALEHQLRASITRRPTWCTPTCRPMSCRSRCRTVARALFR